MSVVSSSATNGNAHRSSDRSASVSSHPGLSWTPIGRIVSPKPVKVISAPMWLSGRRCHAISPQAVNDAGTMKKTTM